MSVLINTEIMRRVYTHTMNKIFELRNHVSVMKGLLIIINHLLNLTLDTR